MKKDGYFSVSGYFDSETELENVRDFILSASSLNADVVTRAHFPVNRRDESEKMKHLEQLVKLSRSRNVLPVILRIDVAIDEELDIEKEIQEQLNLLKERSKNCTNEQLPDITAAMIPLWNALAKTQETPNQGDEV